MGCVGFLYWAVSDGELQQVGKVYYCRTAANVQPGQAPCAAKQESTQRNSYKKLPKTVDIQYLQPSRRERESYCPGKKKGGQRIGGICEKE